MKNIWKWIIGLVILSGVIVYANPSLIDKMNLDSLDVYNSQAKKIFINTDEKCKILSIASLYTNSNAEDFLANYCYGECVDKGLKYKSFQCSTDGILGCSCN